jgi:MYXO-CTERM domain-containing protein
MSLATAGLLTAAASAQSWTESGDAGDIISGVQMTVGAGALTTISGATDTAGGDIVDAYCISITDPGSFYATLNSAIDGSAVASWDTRLWLFDSAGNILLGNDDTNGAGLQSTISDPSTFTALTTGAVNPTASGISLTAGDYILVVGGYNTDALDASGGQIITLSSSFSELHGPNGGAGPLASWTTGFSSGSYTVALSGAAYCQVPAPGALALLGLFGVAGTRRRRRR